MATVPPRGVDAATVPALVRDEQVRTLYVQGVWAAAANAVNAMIVVAILWRDTARAQLVGWLVAALVWVVARLALRAAFGRRQRATDELVWWGRAAVIGSLGSGVLWGVAGAVLMRGESATSQLVVPFVVGGMGAASAGTLSCYMPAFFAFFLPTVVPCIVKFVLIGGAEQFAMASMTTLFVVLMSGIARNVNRALIEAFRLRFENEALVTELGEARRQLLHDNAELESRVSERASEIRRQADERARLENDLQAARRLEAIGRLAGGVAHDFNNALSVVLAGADALREHLHDAHAKHILGDIETSAQGAAQTAQQLLAFSRNRPEQSGVCEPRQVIERFAASVQRMLPESVQIVVEATGDGFIGLPQGQLERVLLNMVLNARDAMPKGGRIWLRSRTDGARVRIEVGDEGTGMDETTRARLFEPYFTTKGLEGTGLGLASAWGTVTSVGGGIDVDSEVGRGTTLRLTFVTVPAPVKESAAAAKAVTSTAGASVLVLEDEDSLRRAIERLLKRAGYDVSAHPVAASAREALAARRFDCLITDALVPGGGVSELVTAFIAANPSAPVIVCSGHVGEQALIEGINSDSYHFVPKPFVPKQLIGLVDRVLNESKTAITN